MVKVTDLLSLQKLDEEVKKGYVKRVLDPTGQLAIISYTNKAQITRDWPTERLLARGLVYRVDPPHQVVARPLAKFFNYGETSFKPDVNAPVVVTDKLDGSLGIFFIGDDGEPNVVTRGSFKGPQAEHATKLYRERYHAKWTPKPRTTYLFEIIFPENRIVLDYKDLDDLVGLCAVNIDTGEVSYSKEIWGDWPGPRTTIFQFKTLIEALNAPARQNAEGVVVQFLDGSGLMLKIKQEDYKALHKVKSGLTPTAIWEALSSGVSADDVCLQTEVDEQHAEIRALAAKYAERLQQVHKTFETLVEFAGDKKLFAQKVLALNDGNSKYLFSLRSGHDISQAVWGAFKP